VIARTLTTLSILLVVGLALPMHSELNGQFMRAQRSEKDVLRQRAETLARLGRIEEAIDIYRELMRTDSRNVSHYYRIAQLLPARDDAEMLLEILDEALAYQPGQTRFLAEKGRLLYLLDRKEEARDHWQAVINQYGRNRYTYTAVTNAQIQAGAVDDALALLTQGRVNLGDSTAFALDLARVYAARLNVEAATREFLNHLWQNPNMENYVSQQIIQLAEKTEAYEPIEQQIRSILQVPQPPPGTVLILSKLYLNHKQYDHVVDLLLENEPEHRLNELTSFAADLHKEKAWDQAAELYLYISTHSNDARRITDALLGLAQTYEERLIQEPDHETLGGYFPGNRFLAVDIKPTIEGTRSLEMALSLYDSLSTLLPRSLQAYQAIHSIAEMQLSILDDFDSAVRGFQLVLSESMNNDQKLEAGVRLVDAWLAKGDTVQAQQALDSVVRETRRDTDDPLIIFSRSKIYLHAGNLVALQKELLNLSGSALPSDELYNDGMELLALMEGNGGTMDPMLAEYMLGEKLIGQHKLSEAAQHLLSIRDSDSGIADEAQVRAVQLLRIIGKQEDAQIMMNEFLVEFPDSPWRPQVLTWLGELKQYHLLDPMSAVPHYEEVIVLHPSFLHVQDVRLRLREILGEGS